MSDSLSGFGITRRAEEIPQAARADAAENVEFRPTSAAVSRNENERRLRTGVHGAGFRAAYCEGFDGVPVQPRRYRSCLKEKVSITFSASVSE